MAYRLINYLWCWKNTRRIRKSLPCGSWFTNSSCVLPTSRVVYQPIRSTETSGLLLKKHKKGWIQWDMLCVMLCRTWWSAVLLLLCARMPCALVVEYGPPCLIKACCVVPVWFYIKFRETQQDSTLCDNYEVYHIISKPVKNRSKKGAHVMEGLR